jgi:hypothetical protein
MPRKKSKKKKKEERPVGEILEEKWTKEREPKPEIKEEKPVEEAPGAKIKLEEEIDLRKTLMDVEKLQAEVNALKEVKFHADERIKELAEAIGEVRSLLFQRDAAIKEMEAKVDKVEEIVSDIKPEKITSQLKKREAEIAENLVKIEKLEKISDDLSKQSRKSQKILENIKSMENLVEASKEIESKLERINELKSGIERQAGKTEKLYFEMDRRLSEFLALKEKTTKVDDLTKELVKSLDELKIKIDRAVTREDMEKSLKEALKPPETTENIEGLNKRKEEILGLLKNLEDQYNKGIISEKSYREVVEKNKGLLKELEEEMKKAETEKRPEDLISWLSQFEEQMKNLRIKTDLLEQKPEKSTSKDVEEMKNQISSLRNELEKQKELVGSLSELGLGQEIISEEEEEKRKAKEREIESIKSLLTTLEDQYREGAISEKTYTEAKNKNLERLKEIETEIEEAKTEKESRIRTLSALLEDFKNNIKNLENRLSLNEEKIKKQKEYIEKTLSDMPKSEKISDELKDTLELYNRTISEIRETLISKIKRLEYKLEKISQEFKSHKPLIIE